jgi:hypothetical protein
VICYRFSSYATPLRTLPASNSGRFNGVNDPQPTQYACLHPLGPLAELMRAADLRTPDQVNAIQVRTWALNLPIDDLTEITFDNATTHGIAPDDLVADDHTACHQLAQRKRSQTPGLIVPSAALPGTRNVVLFGPRVAAPYLTPPATNLDIPASITADRGKPLLSLINAVRFKGYQHAELEASNRGDSFQFVEPDWSL